MRRVKGAGKCFDQTQFCAKAGEGCLVGNVHERFCCGEVMMNGSAPGAEKQVLVCKQDAGAPSWEPNRGICVYVVRGARVNITAGTA